MGHFFVPNVSLLQILHSKEACVDSFAFYAEQVVQTAPCLIGLREFHEELEQKRIVDNILYALRLVDHLLDEALLNRYDSVVGHIGRVVDEETVNDQIEQLINHQMIRYHSFLAVWYQELIAKSVEDFRVLPEEAEKLLDGVGCVF